MFIRNLFRLKEIKVKPKDYILSYLFGGFLYKSKLYRWLAGGTWYRYSCFGIDRKVLYFWSRIADMEKSEFGVMFLVKTEKYN